MSKCLRALIGALFVAWLPGVSEAAIIQQCWSIDPDCVLVGEFNWTRDDFGDIFQLGNLSSGGLAGNFIALDAPRSSDVQLEGGSDSSAALDQYPIAPLFSAETDPLSAVTSAYVTFLFHGVEFTAGLKAGDLDPGFSYASTAIFAQPVPEPTTLLLLGSGAVVSILRSRRRRPR